MKDDILARLFLLLPLSCAGSIVCAQCDVKPASAAPSKRLLIAQGEPGGTITPDKIRGVVEIHVRRVWQPVNGPEGATTVVRFVIDSAGRVSGSPTVQMSGGNAAFDNSCVDAISKIGPLPPLPNYLGKEIVFLAKYHSGKAAWVDLEVDQTAPEPDAVSLSAQPLGDLSQGGDTAAGGTSSSGTGSGDTSSGSTGQSGWTQPSASASTGQSDWVQPSSSATAGQSDWVQPSGSASVGQSDWVQPSGSSASVPMGTPPAGSQLASPMGTSPSSSASAVPMGLQPSGSAPSVPTRTQQASSPNTPMRTQQTGSASAVPRGTQPAGGTQPPTQMGSQQRLSPEEISQQVVLLNNKAVVSIADNNYELAIRQLEEALNLDPKYPAARANLAIAYNNFGLQLKDRPEEAIKVFHKAFALDPTNEKTKINLETIIQYMGKNAKSFKDRLDLGNKAIAQGDKVGAQIEYAAALAIKPDPIVQQKLYALRSGTSPNGTPDDPTRHHGIQHSGNQQQINTGRPATNQQGSSTAGSSPSVSPTAKTPAQRTPAQKPPAQTPPKAGATKTSLAVTKGGGTAQSKPAALDYTDDTTGSVQPGAVSQKLDTMYRNLKNLEVKTFGKPFEADDILSRLSRLEQKLLGKVQQGKPMRRLDALLLLQ